MAITRPDIYQHNNPNKSIVDSINTRGGHHSVSNKSSRNSIPEDKRSLRMLVSYDDSGEVTAKFIGSTIDDVDWTDDLNWEALDAGGASVYTFTNGITEATGIVKLGGTLTEATTLTCDANQFTISNTSGSYVTDLDHNATVWQVQTAATAGATHFNMTNANYAEMYAKATATTNPNRIRVGTGSIELQSEDGGIVITDYNLSGSRNLMQYAADYTADMLDDRMIPDLGHVVSLIAAGGLVFENGLTNTTGTVTLGGANPLLANTAIDMDSYTFTLDGDADNVLLTAQPTGGTELAIATTKYVDDKVVSGVTASNGLTEVGGDIQLGGTLTEAVSLTGTGDALNFAISLNNIGATETYEFDMGPDSGEILVSASSGTDVGYFGASSDGAYLQGDNSSGVTTISVNAGAVEIDSSIVAFAGAQYAADYSANYTNRSLVDKEYVDGAGGLGAGSGLTENTGNIDLGGTLTGTTNIAMDTNPFSITNEVLGLDVVVVDDVVQSISIHSSGFYVGGMFTDYGGTSAEGIIKISSDYSIDGSFTSGFPSGGWKHKRSTIMPDNDSLLVATYEVLTYDATTINYLMVIDGTGSLNTAFSTNIGAGFDNYVQDIIISDDDNYIYAGGGFSNFQSNGTAGLVKLNIDGTEVSAFSTALGDGFDGQVRGIIELPISGDIIVTGAFTTLDSVSAPGIVRLSSAGVRNSTFDTNVGAGILTTGSGNDAKGVTLAIDSSENIYVGGSFKSFDALEDYSPATIVALRAVTGYADTEGAIVDDIRTSYIFDAAETLPDDGDIYITPNDITEPAPGRWVKNKIVSTGIIKLSSAGVEDTTFSTNVGIGFGGSTAYASEITVIDILYTSGGDLLVVGDFQELDGSSIATGVVMLTTAGVIDVSFDAGDGFQWNTNDAMVQVSTEFGGGYIIGGAYFNNYDNTYGLENIVQVDTTGNIMLASTLDFNLSDYEINLGGNVTVEGSFTVPEVTSSKYDLGDWRLEEVTNGMELKDDVFNFGQNGIEIYNPDLDSNALSIYTGSEINAGRISIKGYMSDVSHTYFQTQIYGTSSGGEGSTSATQYMRAIDIDNGTYQSWNLYTENHGGSSELRYEMDGLSHSTWDDTSWTDDNFITKGYADGAFATAYTASGGITLTGSDFSLGGFLDDGATYLYLGDGTAGRSFRIEDDANNVHFHVIKDITTNNGLIDMEAGDGVTSMNVTFGNDIFGIYDSGSNNSLLFDNTGARYGTGIPDPTTDNYLISRGYADGRYLPSLEWTGLTSTDETAFWSAIVYGNNKFVAVGQNAFMYSIDGVSWNAATEPEDNGWIDVAYGDGLFVAISSTGTNRAAISQDGINWTSVVSSPINTKTPYSIAYGDGTFVIACGESGSGQMIYSDDGETWTASTFAGDGDWRAVAYGDGVFVAVAWTNTNRVARSTDNGVTWADLNPGVGNLGLNVWEDICYGDGKFVAVRRSGAYANSMTSTDGGLTWTGGSLNNSAGFEGVAYGNNMFIAVADAASSGDMIYTSENGSDWTAYAPPAENAWRAIVYANDMWVSVAATGTDRIMIAGGITDLSFDDVHIVQGDLNINGDLTTTGDVAVTGITGSSSYTDVLFYDSVTGDVQYGTAPAGATLIGNTDATETLLGDGAGNVNTGSDNTFLGHNAGLVNVAGEKNTFIGEVAGSATIGGSYNTFTGYRSGQTNTSGNFNTFYGVETGSLTLSGVENTYMGRSAGASNSVGDYNAAYGYAAGFAALGDGNVFLGAYAGRYETGSDSFYVNNYNTTSTALDKTNSLMYGIFDTDPANQELTVNGTLEVTGGVKGVMNVAKVEFNFDTATSGTIITLPIDAIIKDIAVEVRTLFNGTTPTLDVGVTGTSGKYVDDEDISTTFFYDRINNFGFNPDRMSASTNITFATTLSGATAGQGFIYVYYTIF